MATSTDISNKLVSTNTAITHLESTIKAFKKDPIQGQSGGLLASLNQIKESWNQVIANNAEKNFDIDAIVTRIQFTENKVKKVLEKYPPASSEAQWIALSAAKEVISFNDTDIQTSCFGNSHPCNIEFGGRVYQNAESAFQAQKYTDQPNAMDTFQTFTAKNAVRFSNFFIMTPTREKEWNSQTPNVNKVDVMMNVLRAKFGQHPELKERLEATGTACLINHQGEPGPGDKFWGDGFDGSGENMLGICLMRLRKEYWKTPVVEKSSSTVIFYKFCQEQWEKKWGYSSSPAFSSSSVTNAAQPVITNATQFQTQYTLQTKCIVCQTAPKFIDLSGIIYDYCSKTICDKS